MDNLAKRSPLLHEETTGAILACAFDVINELGAGFLESVYEKALYLTLQQKGHEVVAQRPIDVLFRGHLIGSFYADLLVDDRVMVEIKAIRSLAPEHMAQVINYLKATGIEVGLLINFGSSRLEYKRLTRHATLDPPAGSQNGDTPA
jgi:GxxExxY protein